MSIKKTITSIFMVPSLNISKEALDNNGFINGYAGDIDQESNFPDSIYMLFKPVDVDRFREFLGSEYERTKDIIEDYDYPGGFVVVIYKMNPLYKADYALITQGKYSHVSAGYKQLFPSVIEVEKNGVKTSVHSIQYRVFNKTLDIKLFWESKIGVVFDSDQEMWDIYEKEDELLNINKL
jgi:hypothetical protein